MAFNPHSKTDVATRAEAQRSAYEMKLKGMSNVAIAEVMGVSPSTISRYVKAEATAQVLGPAEEYRAMELDRLDRYLSRLESTFHDCDHEEELAEWAENGRNGAPPVCRQDIPKSVLAALKVADHRAKLLGLYAPVKVDAQVAEVTQADLELQALLREAKTRAAMQAQALGAKTPGPDAGEAT